MIMTVELHHIHGEICPLCEQKLISAHETLATWFRDGVKPAYPSAHISWSFRDKSDQELAFLNGKTRLHFPDSAHNKSPSLALDLFQLDIGGNGLWDHEFFAALHTINAVKFPYIIWGGLWKSIGDADHFEYVPSDSKPEESKC